jgi:hypothetical protein
MITRREVEMIGLLIVVTLAAAFLRGWMLERDARNSAEEFSKAQTAKISELGQAAKASQAQDEAYRAGKSVEAASISTPQQAVKIITEYLPASPTDPHAPQAPLSSIPVVPAEDLDAAVRAELPAAPSYAILTPAQAEAIAKNDLACDADRHSLSACSLQLADADQATKIAEAEAGKWEKAAKGGTLLKRIGRVLKLSACSAAGSAIAAAATHGSNSEYPAVAAGAASGAIACSLF